MGPPGGWARYRPDIVDAVFVGLGAVSEARSSPTDPFAWGHQAEGRMYVASFVPERGIPGMRADHLEHLARKLRFDPTEVFRRVRAAGGEILDL